MIAVYLDRLEAYDITDEDFITLCNLIENKSYEMIRHVQSRGKSNLGKN